MRTIDYERAHDTAENRAKVVAELRDYLSQMTETAVNPLLRKVGETLDVVAASGLSLPELQAVDGLVRAAVHAARSAARRETPPRRAEFPARASG